MHIVVSSLLVSSLLGFTLLLCRCSMLWSPPVFLHSHSSPLCSHRSDRIIFGVLNSHSDLPYSQYQSPLCSSQWNLLKSNAIIFLLCLTLSGSQLLWHGSQVFVFVFVFVTWTMGLRDQVATHISTSSGGSSPETRPPHTDLTNVSPSLLFAPWSSVPLAE